jgi:hypothetical protein
MVGPEEHASAGPEHGPSRERPSPGTYLTPYAPEPEPGYRSRPVTAVLVAVALVVAVGAGGAVYAVLDDESPGATPTVPSASP